MVKNNSEYLEDSRYLKLATIGVMNYNICMMTKDTDINNLPSTPNLRYRKIKSVVATENNLKSTPPY